MTEKNKLGHRQRLRESFLDGKDVSHTDKALLELLFTYAIPQKDVQPLVSRLIIKFGSLSGVLEASPEDLIQFDGIKLNTATLLKLVDWIRTNYPLPQKSKTQLTPPHILQGELFGASITAPPETVQETKQQAPIKTRVIPRHGTELFGKAVLKEAINLLPTLPTTESLNEIRHYLRAHLHFSAEQTRLRYANYITRRMFPLGYADSTFLKFSKHFAGGRNLQEACFYRFLKAEPIMVKVILELLLPAIGTGRVSRKKIREFLSTLYPESRNITDSTQGIVGALVAGGIVKADREIISFGFREISLPVFAFILHSEFPEPGMYDLLKAETNHPMLAMLWNPSQILPSLYELRNLGIIAKISEIDSVRQFSTKLSLEKVVDHLIAGVNLK